MLNYEAKELIGQTVYLISVQYMENYGSRWKFKLGDTHVIPASEKTPETMIAAVDSLDLINNSQAREVIISVQFKVLTAEDCEY
ncbi:hypothetical protein AD45P2_00210 [Alteromonas phage vB_AmaP_AD45-P2]|uniref:Uncharacterized protein n=1 Tax=Pseudorhizobium pelagicum TaxID=1509405 RepID=A0A922P2U2_9HYPH|nr:hypothetical protein [Pseudorhizobium pelagicum]YP_008126014.1 hypothetical protein M610_gp043 [Alteromonas phage vB_AmaP_AD45-P1]AGM46981.1 hypothetical protein AD45P3_00215 [Alteromonas phage vB_AmaP_AD45-P3]AGM47098.1 hypothetical protein AD45P4_00215 [Alteromonas phage vB_AmaP_AD45-P4]AGM47213.1 hypothetical protein AD45P2_00210 [Alteromonas phage vB_AmaP_AD45-P2]AGM46861.1 hypothetical protein AD45P1_00215 [Alteromonas phage vB_AmaP_AD45-P1]KEQ05549.1 hypothetical protein GV68_08445 [